MDRINFDCQKVETSQSFLDKSILHTAGLQLAAHAREHPVDPESS